MADEPSWAWQPIETMDPLFKDGREVLLAVEVASVWLVRNAAWSDGELWAMQGSESQEQARGWWYYVSSVGQLKMDGIYTPTHWMPMARLPRG